MPPPPPPPSNESDEAEDKYLNACAAGVDSAEARLAMFRLEKLAQVALKVWAHARPAQPRAPPSNNTRGNILSPVAAQEKTLKDDAKEVGKAIFQAVTSGWILILIGKKSGMTMSSRAEVLTSRFGSEQASARSAGRAASSAASSRRTTGSASSGCLLRVAASLASSSCCSSSCAECADRCSAFIVFLEQRRKNYFRTEKKARERNFNAA
jgi:hypothetical protein